MNLIYDVIIHKNYASLSKKINVYRNRCEQTPTGYRHDNFLLNKPVYIKKKQVE